MNYAIDNLECGMDSTDSATPSTKRRDLWQFAVGYALILAVIWTPRPWQQPLYVAAVVFILASMQFSSDDWNAMGFRRANFLRSLWVPGVALLAAALAVAEARHLDTLHPTGPFSLYVKSFWGYAIWSLAQQILLQGFFLMRLLRLLPSPRVAVFVAASTFALAHLPNPILTVMTLAWGMAACWVFLRYRNLYSLGIAHAILGICVAITFPGPVIRNMRVGLGYLTYPRDQPMPSAATVPTRTHTGAGNCRSGFRFIRPDRRTSLRTSNAPASSSPGHCIAA